MNDIHVALLVATLITLFLLLFMAGLEHVVEKPELMEQMNTTMI